MAVIEGSPRPCEELRKGKRLKAIQENRPLVLWVTLARIAGLLVLCASLGACTWLFLGPTNHARPVQLSASPPAEGFSRLVFGIDASSGPLTIDLVAYDPASGDIGTCVRSDRVSASTPAGSTGVTYFAFDVPAGHYRVGHYEAPLPGEQIFVAPAGSQNFLGTFANSPTIYSGPPKMPRRDLDEAKLAVGEAGAALNLAEMRPFGERPKFFVCTP